MREVQAAEITQLDPLQVAPEAFARIQLRRIGGQSLEVEALRRAVGQECLDGMAAMDGGAIPDDDHAAWHLAQQVLQEGHDVFRVDGTVLAVEIQLALRGDGAHGRQMLTRPPLAQAGSVPHRGIRADDTGQRVEPGFIDEEDALLLSLRPLLMAAQVSWCHRVIAASSR